MSKTLSVTTAYNNSDQTRTYNLEIADSLEPATVQANIIALNNSIASGQVNDLVNLFVSDDYDSSDGTGTLTGITAAKIQKITETPISE